MHFGYGSAHNCRFTKSALGNSSAHAWMSFNFIQKGFLSSCSSVTCYGCHTRYSPFYSPQPSQQNANTAKMNTNSVFCIFLFSTSSTFFLPPIFSYCRSRSFHSQLLIHRKLVEISSSIWLKFQQELEVWRKKLDDKESCFIGKSQ